MHTFVYGSLMFDVVWDSLITSRYQRTAARLDGYARVGVSGEVYPGLIEAEGGAVNGVLINSVSAADVQLLDCFEGDHYRRTPVTVVTPRGEVCRAETYLFRDEFRYLLTGSEWEVDEFRDKGIKAMLSHLIDACG